MKILNFNNYINEGYDKKENLIYYSFDIDDNLLYMSTKIHMDHLVDGEWVTELIGTDTFSEIRGDKVNWRFKTGHDGEESLVEFCDWGPDGDNTFLKAFKYSVNKKRFGPSWNKFIECLVTGKIFSIITSRGHSPENIRRAFEWLIYEYGLDNFKNLQIKNVDKSESFDNQMINNLLKFHELFDVNPYENIIDEYLDCCPIYPISSDYFKEKFGKSSSENAKKMAINDFNDVVKGYAKKLGVKAKYGFSDDDPKFVKSAIDQFRELKGDKRNKDIKYSVFDTGNKGMKKLKI
jgi:hypothetical protein